MIGVLTERVVEAYGAPRRSARRILDAQPSPLEALMMALAGFALVAVGSGAMRQVYGPVDGNDPLMATLFGQALSWATVFDSVLIKLIEFYVTALLAWAIGAQMGGRAGRRDLMAVVGWHGLVVAPAVILFLSLVGVVGPGGREFAALVFFVGGIYMIYMLAAFIAEAHGFERVWTVFIAIIWITLAVLALLVLAGGGGMIG